MCSLYGKRLLNCYRDGYSIQNDPSVQWQLKMIEQEEAEFESEVKERFKK